MSGPSEVDLQRIFGASSDETQRQWEGLRAAAAGLGHVAELVKGDDTSRDYGWSCTCGTAGPVRSGGRRAAREEMRTHLELAIA